MNIHSATETKNPSRAEVDNEVIQVNLERNRTVIIHNRQTTVHIKNGIHNGKQKQKTKKKQESKMGS